MAIFSTFLKWSTSVIIKTEDDTIISINKSTVTKLKLRINNQVFMKHSKDTTKTVSKTKIGAKKILKRVNNDNS